MRTFIITLEQIEHSRNMAERCRQSAKKVGYKPEIEHFKAVFADEWKEHLPKSANTRVWQLVKTARTVAGCFASHYLLWKKCVELDEPILILEHDATFIRNIPEDLEFDKCINFGAPSFFRADDCCFVEPKEGVHPMRDLIMFGHHGYAVKPEAAKQFVHDVEKGRRLLVRNDVYMSRKHYPWLEECYPWCISANENDSTVSFEGVKVEHTTAIGALNEEQYEFKERHFPKRCDGYSPNLRKMHVDMKKALGIEHG